MFAYWRNYHPMIVNKNIKFGISRKGIHYLVNIPIEQIDRYWGRLNSYENVKYRTLKSIKSEQKCDIYFLDIDKNLRNKLKVFYGFIDERRYSLPISEKVFYFSDRRQYFIICPRVLPESKKQIDQYLKQHKVFDDRLEAFINLTYTVMYSSYESYGDAIFYIHTLPCFIVEEISSLTHSSDMVNEKKLEILNFIEEYQKSKIESNKNKPVFGISKIPNQLER